MLRLLDVVFTPEDHIRKADAHSTTARLHGLIDQESLMLFNLTPPGSSGGCLFAIYGEEEGKRTEGEVVALWDVRADSRQSGSRLRLTRTPDARLRMGMCMCLRLYSSSDHAGGDLPCLATSWENGHLYLWDLRQPAAPYASSEAAAGGQRSAGRLHDEPPLAFDLATTADGHVRGISGGADAHLSVFVGQLPAVGGESNAGVGDQGSSSSASGGSTTTSHLTLPSPISIECKLELRNAGVGSVAIRHRDQRIFATGGWDKRVRIWDYRRPRPLAILKAHTGAVNCLAFSPTEGDNLLVSGSADTRIACWSIY